MDNVKLQGTVGSSDHFNIHVKSDKANAKPCRRNFAKDKDT